MNNQVTGYDRSGLPNATKDSVEFRLNPNPKQAYRVKVKVDNAPGPWKHKDLNVKYMARNCTYTVNRFAGATGNPEHIIVIKSEVKREDYLEGIVYLDAMQDEDYYGQGTCHWELLGISAMFKATDDPEETIFISLGFKNELFPPQTNTKYYLKEDYPQARVNGKLLNATIPAFGTKKRRKES
ncbi:MAG: hypothetical protein N4Q30_04900 [Neisseriaceae bacterium]|nr:hypothetical protein [Neisseriaceae bacterium]